MLKTKPTKRIEPQTLKEWYKDTGRKMKDVATSLNVDYAYLSQINSGRVTPGESLKASFRRLYPGYDVIEMRSIIQDSIRPEINQPLVDEAPEAFEPSKYIERVAEESVEERALPIPSSKEDISETKHEPMKVYVLQERQGAIPAAAFLTRAKALEELTMIILDNPDAYGWSITEAEVR